MKTETLRAIQAKTSGVAGVYDEQGSRVAIITTRAGLAERRLELAKLFAAELSWGGGPYTPHPWRVRYYPERLDKTLTAYVVTRGKSGGFLVLDNNPGRARADAYLIGAAPALAEALRALVNAYDGQGSTVAALAAARAALQYAGVTQ